MSEIQTFDHLQFDAYAVVLNERLADVPELVPALDWLGTNLGKAAEIYTGYTRLVDDMAALSETDRQITRTAQMKMKQNGSNFGTASEISADELLAEGNNKELFHSLIGNTVDADSPYAVAAFDELHRRMAGGHALKLAGKQPSDDDPESHQVIWGHTMITDPEVLAHFMFCHYLERYFAVALADQGSQLARQKDFLLNALIDVVLVDHISENRYADIFERWQTPKNTGGLGWITDDRLASYEIQR